MRIAIIHDWLLQMGGAEKVLLEIYRSFSGDIYTLMLDEELSEITKSIQHPIYTSFLQHIPNVKKHYAKLLPLFPLAIKSFDLSNYDLILSSSWCVAKGIKTHKNQMHICYCHTPMRYLWDMQQEYIQTHSWIKGMGLKAFTPMLKRFDTKNSGVNYFIANSQYVANRIQQTYNIESTVIYPPVAIEKYPYQDKERSYYVTCSRLVPYKRVGDIIRAFNLLDDMQLIVIGEGPEFDKLQALKGENITLTGRIVTSQIAEIYSQAKGFIYAAKEDFGISVVEAQAAGLPVLAYGEGGAKETLIPNITGQWFTDREPNAFAAMIRIFDGIVFNRQKIVEFAERFSAKRFKQELETFVFSCADFSRG